MKKKSKAKKTSTKLKTKLAATLVAIISVIAVMGVGVFASLSNFSVVVTNGVNISFFNLSGTISVSAESGTDNLGTAGPKLNETVLYSAGTTRYTKISVNDTAGENLKYAGANFLTTEDGGITDETKAGVVAYTFKHTPVSSTSTAGSLKVAVEETSKPTMKGGELVTAYFVSTNGSTWAEITSGIAVTPVKDNQELYVLAICQYHNQNLVATKSTQTAWNFNLTMWSAEDEVVELTYDNALLEMTDGLSDGVGLSEDFVPSTGTEEEFVYEISEDGKYIYFGEYPQTLMSADMDPETDLEQISDHYYRGTDGEIYYEYTIDLDANFEVIGTDEATWVSLDMLDASTGEEMVNGGTYYFKMEKIKWRILEESNGTYTIVADTNLQALAYQPTYTQYGIDYYTTANGAPEGTFANNYKYSELRRFLNDDFMDFAFSEEQKALIQQDVEVDNSLASTGEETNPYVCENTFDDVWALSVSEVTTLIGEEGSDDFNSWTADLETSDFSRATGVLTYTEAFVTGMMGESAVTELAAWIGTGVSWLRSPKQSYSFLTHEVGDFFDYFNALDPYGGILPAIQLKIN